MKKEYAIRTLLGITQQDAALLFRVSRSQWSMFESGKRDLPLAAQQLLAEMLTHVQSGQTAKNAAPEKVAAQQQHVERLIRENEYQQLLVARKTAEVAKKQAAQERLAQVVDFLQSRHSGTQKGAGVLQTIGSKAALVLALDHSATLIEHELKQEVLVLEKLLLESKLRKIAASLVNKEADA